MREAVIDRHASARAWPAWRGWATIITAELGALGAIASVEFPGPFSAHDHCRTAQQAAFETRLALIGADNLTRANTNETAKVGSETGI
jgi:hypothetical protein